MSSYLILLGPWKQKVRVSTEFVSGKHFLEDYGIDAFAFHFKVKINDIVQTL